MIYIKNPETVNRSRIIIIGGELCELVASI